MKLRRSERAQLGDNTPPLCRASERVAYDSEAANSERIKVTTENNDSYTKTEHNHQQIVGTCLRHVLNCCRIVGGIKNKNIKKQPWSKVEGFAFGGATVRFASLETSFHAANHTIPPPPSYEGLPLYPKDKNRSPFHGEKPLMIK